MGNDWIIGVLADLRSFAKDNELPLLAVQLAQTSLIAQAEIAQVAKTTPMAVQGESAETRSIFSQAGAGRRS